MPETHENIKRNIAGIGDLAFYYRLKLREKTTAGAYPFASFSSIRASLSPEKLSAGAQGIYLSPEVTLPGGRRYFWPVADVDGHEGNGTGRKKSVAAAVANAHAFAQEIKKHDMAAHAEILLTGSGFRFSWPFLLETNLLPGWVEFLRTLAAQDVDVGPVVNPRQPVRLLAYRGHRAQQDGDIYDRHGTRIDAETFWALDEEAYLEITAGRPDGAECIRHLEAILPTSVADPTTPGAVGKFVEHLAELAIEAALDSNVDRFRFAGSGKKLRLESLLAHLDEQDIQYRWKGETAILLMDCPSCGGRHKAWVSPVSGRLRCFRDTCPANARTGGLHVKEWTGGAELEHDEEPPRVEILENSDTAEARIRDHLDRPGNLAIGATCGIGKTRLAIERAIKDAEAGRVIFALPNHAQCAEKAAATARDTDIPVLHLYGRRATEKPKTCINIGALKKSLSLGLRPGASGCLSCKHHPGRTRVPCAYYEQFRRLDEAERAIIFCATAQLPSLAALPLVKRLYIDEQALNSLTHHSKCGLDALQTLAPYLSQDSVAVLDAITDAGKRLQRRTARGRGPVVGRLYSRAPAGQWAGKADLWQAIGMSKDIVKDTLSDDITGLLDMPELQFYHGRINMTALNWLCAATGDGVAWVQADTRGANGHISFSTSQFLALPRSIPVTVLDATIDMPEIESLLGRRFEALDARVGWEAKRVFIRQGVGKVRLGRMGDTALAKLMKDAVRHVPEDAKKALIITFLRDEKRVLKIAKKQKPGIEWVSTHWFASRGLNVFEDCDAVICIGTPTHSPGATADLAALLFPENVAEQERWRRRQDTNELVQGVHRLRFARYPGKTLIVAGRHWPGELGEEPDADDRRRGGSHCSDYKDLAKRAAERLLPIFDATGFLTKELAEVGGVFEKSRIQKAEKAERAYVAEFIAKEFVGTPNNIYRYKEFLQNNLLLPDRNHWPEILARIESLRPGCGRLEVKAAGRGRPSRGLGTVDAARKFFEALLGEGGFQEQFWQQVEPAERDES